MWAPLVLAAAAAGGGVELVYEHTVRGNQDLYAVSTADGTPRRLTTHPGSDALPRWTRDGRRVVFSSERSGNWQLYELAAEGGEPRRLRRNAHREWQADLSPDGGWLAFLSNAEGPEHLFVMALRDGGERALVRHGRRTVLGNPHWSADGRRIVFSTNWPKGHGIHIVDVASGAERPLDPALGSGCEPRFHPDGRRVVYVSRGGHAAASRLVEYDLESGSRKTLVDWPALNYNPVYSPDGAEIAFSSNITGEWVVYRQRLSDGKSWRVTHGGGPARNPDYRP
jgi:TolB protein